MRINVVGAGPAGLYSAILLKRSRPDLVVRMFERNTAGATFGFGVVFSQQALAFLRDGDPETADLIEPHMQRWTDIRIVHRGESVAIDGIGFAGIGRLELLALLQRRAAELGVTPEWGAAVASPDALPPADLTIGADGLNSVVRRSAHAAFGARIAEFRNRFVWYGADRGYDALTQTFIDTPHGPMTAHHYSYAPGRATFIIEMAPETFHATGFASMAEPDYRAACAALFADHLGGANLIPNNSVWRQFPDLNCARWHAGTTVLVGDALHTAHFSIGSGTRLALEDAIALVRALEAEAWQVARALPAYQAARQPVLRKITDAARQSARWYEGFGDRMALAPWPFALDYIRRAGRLDDARLARMAPGFTDGLRSRGLIGAAA